MENFTWQARVLEMQLLACDSHPFCFDPIVMDWSDQPRTRWLSSGDSSIGYPVPGVAQASMGMPSAGLEGKIAPWALDDLGERKGVQEQRGLSNTDPNQILPAQPYQLRLIANGSLRSYQLLYS